ncbi:MAG: GNAT family N-acetyltransferase [Chloroflexi bacterium]|nr:GNAT family N-acetyltransferase [Chloroflexota bacterium]
MLQGQRVTLVPIEREHLPNYVRWFADREVLEYFGPYLPLNLAQEEKWYELMLEDETTVAFAVEMEGQHIGGCGFTSINHRHQSAEAGLFIGEKSLWNMGLGQDILTTLLHYGFDYLNFHRIYLRVFAENERAIRAYEKVGFEHEGRFREAEWRHGRRHDLLFMSILRHEWKRESSRKE